MYSCGRSELHADLRDIPSASVRLDSRYAGDSVRPQRGVPFTCHISSPQSLMRLSQLPLLLVYRHLINNPGCWTGYEKACYQYLVLFEPGFMTAQPATTMSVE